MSLHLLAGLLLASSVVASAPPPATRPGIRVPPPPQLPARATPTYGAGGEAKLDPTEKRMQAALPSKIAVDDALSRAARSLAIKANEARSLELISQPEALRLALARAGAVAPEVAPIAVRATDLDAALGRLKERLKGESAQLVGLGTAEGGGEVALVALLGADRLAMKPFPVQVETGSVHTFEGRVKAPLKGREVYVTPPGGTPVRLPISGDAPAFRVPISFPSPGRYTVEVLGHGPRGPEVAAILEVFAGVPLPQLQGAAAVAAEPAGAKAKEALVARAVNDLRRKRGLKEVAVDPKLAKIARAYAEEMARTGRFAHRSELSGELGDRLQAGGYAFRRAGENLAQAPTALGAHDSTVRSPGHLANLIDPAWTEAGFGVAETTLAGGSPTVILVEVFAAPR